jgi:hypothetical protein
VGTTTIAPVNAIAFAVGTVAVVATLQFVLPGRAAQVSNASLETHFSSRDVERRARSLFDWTGANRQDSILMWGWQPELTAYSGLRPAGRAAHTEYLIRPNPGRDYFRERLLRDIAIAEPLLVVDSVRPGYFFANYNDFSPATSSITSFPSLSDIVQRDYEAIGRRTDCAGVYLRRDKAAAWHRAEITLDSDASALVDNSITERCHDWWAPEGAGETTVTVHLRKPEPVEEVWLLASRGGEKRDRGTTRVHVDFVDDDGTRTSEEVDLFDYPRWTVVWPRHGGRMQDIVITTRAHVGSGAALNEVKAFRVSPLSTAQPR